MYIGLLEYLAYRTSDPPISDLRIAPHMEKIQHIVSSIPLDACVEREWIDAAKYLFPDKPCGTAREAKMLLAGMNI